MAGTGDGHNDQDGVFSRIRQWSASPTTRRQRLTGQEWLDQHEDKRARRRKRLDDPDEREKRRSRVVIGVSLGIIVVSLTGALLAGGQADTRDDEISQLTTQVEQVRAQNDTVITDPEVVRDAVGQMGTDAQAVADLQNEYRGWLTSSAPEDEARVTDLHTRLSQYVPDNAAVRWFSPLTRDSDGNVVALGADQYSWQTTVGYTATDTSAIPITWLCVDGDGTLLAWTSAVYNAQDQDFTSVSTGVTSAGARLLISDDTGEQNETTEG